MGIVESEYRKNFIRRYDDTGYLRYFCAADFPELRDEPFTFPSGTYLLAAHWYSCGDPREGELVIFCHGIGGGHRSYMQEIVALCRRGYRVLAYDNTGCFDSEGPDIISMSHSLADLDACLRYLKNEGIFQQFTCVFVIGHSWGGFAAGNIASLHDGIAKAVVISGFISTERLLEDNLSGMALPLRKTVHKRLCAFEKKAAPDYFETCTLDAVNGRKTRFLFAHSTDDPMVLYDRHTGFLREHTDNPYVRWRISEGRKHNPNYTQDAVDYMNDMFAAFNQGVKDGSLKTLADKQRHFADADWVRMTAQDDAFWDDVAAFLQEP